MRLAHHLLRHPSGMWHFRLIVPRALQALIGRKVIKQSLRTRDPIIAKAWAYALGAQYAQILGNARERGMPGPRTSGFEIQFDDEEFSFKSIKTDNTPSDNAAALEAIRLIAELRQAKAATSPPAAETIAPALSPKRQIQIAKATEAWLIAIKGDTLKKTLTIKAAAVNGFAKHFGTTKMLHDVQREDVHAWVEALRTSGLQTPTLVNKCSYLRGFLDWAMRAGYIPKFPADENPAVGHVIFRKREKQKRRALGFKAFTTEQVQLLFSPAALANLSEGARWGAVIGLYTGARVSEVGQLALSNFTTVDGVPCLTITDDGKGQSVKNHASLRTIPIHPDLIALGLMDRVEALRRAGETQLFPKVKLTGVNGMGNWLSKAFTRHIEAMKVSKPAKGKYGFHSLRKTAIQTMKSARVPLEWRCAYVGHELDEEHVEAYSGDYGPLDMLDAVKGGLAWGVDLRGIRVTLPIP